MKGYLMVVAIDVVAGDITQQPADALITAVSSYGSWYGGVDRAIQGVAGNMFHGQLSRAGQLCDGRTVYAPATDQHRGQFQGVLFVVDDFRLPLNDLILTALVAAENLRLRRLTLPAIRTGVALGVKERTAEEAVKLLSQGVRTFAASKPHHVRSIRFVIYNDGTTQRMLGQALQGTRS